MNPATMLGTGVAALLNSLWQGAAIALLVWAALRLLTRLNVRINAATRGAVWWAVLAAVVLLPFAPTSGKQVSPPGPDVYTASPVDAPEIAAVVAPAAVAPAAIDQPEAAPAQLAQPSPSTGPLRLTGGSWLLALFTIWAVLSLFRLTQLIRSYRYLRGIKERSRPVSPERLVNFNYWLLACGIDRTVRLVVSGEIVSPMAVGFRRPAVIVPETLMHEFTADELDHVLLHELAHIARYDDWTNLFARLIGALLPVHPVAVWLLKRIEQEREVACDDWVVAMTGEARPYAASLTRLFELCSARRRQLLATGMADRASHLGERIEALLRGGRDFAPRVSLLRVGLGVAILASLVLIGAQAPQWIAFAQEPAAAPVPPVPPAVPLTPGAPVPPAPAAAPVPPVAAAAPAPPEPPVAPAPIAELDSQPDAQQAIRMAEREIAQLQQLLREERRRYTPEHPEMRRLAEEIRAQQAQVRALAAQLRAGRNDSRLTDELAAKQAELQAQELRLQALQLDQTHRQLAQTQPQQAQAPQALPQPAQPGNQQRPQVRGSFLAALVAAGYGDLPVDDIIALRNSGVSAEFLRSVAEAGWGKLSVKELMDLAHGGVSPQYLRSLSDAGFKKLSIQEAIEVAHSGVRTDLMRVLKDAFPQITMREIIDAAHSGLNPNDLRQAREYGPNLTLEQILRLKHAGVI